MAAVMLLLLMPTALPAAETGDIGPDHWAYKTMKGLIGKGYLSSYGDGTLGAGKAVTRLDFAVAVDKLLKEIEGGKVQALREDLSSVRKLINEFRNEMVDSQSKLKDLDDKISYLDKQRVVLHEDFARMTVGMRASQKEMADLKEELDRTKVNLAAANTDLATLRKDLNAANDSINASKEMEARLQKSQRRTNIFLGLALVLALIN